MTSIPFTIAPEASIAEAVALMRVHGVRHLPVESQDKAVGILSDWDILSAASLPDVLREPVASRMTPHPYCVTGDTPVEIALRFMTENGLGCTLIIDSDDKVVGIFTEKDAMRMFVELIAEPAPRLRVARLQ
ncbi:MAG: CBS domain-containing protein [Oligoflexia bacterium]|nr:CBS domain-containing protein [Oligoflexia bacterium]